MKKWLSILISAFIVIVSGCGRPSGGPGHNAAQIAIIVDGTPQTLDPILMTEVMSASLGNACHAPLVRLRQDGSTQPELAESITISSNGFEAIIKLKEAKFWDQSPVTASDVAWSLIRLRDSQSPLKLTVERIEKIEEIDKLTVKVSFSQPEPDFIKMVAHLQAAILKKGSDHNSKAPLDQNLVGAGAFIPDSFNPGVSYGFRRNPGFPRNSNIEKLFFLVKTDSQSQLAAIRSGEAQILRLKGPTLREAVTSNDAAGYAARPQYSQFNIISADANEINLAIINWNAQVFATVTTNLRETALRTISTRLDRKALAKALGGVSPADSVIPKSALNQPSNQGTVESASNEPPKIPKLELLSSTDPMSRELAATSQPFLRDAGLDTALRNVDPGRLIETVIKKQHEGVVITFEMPVVGVPPWLLFFSNGPFVAFGEPLDDLSKSAQEARSILNSEERAKAWESISASLNAKQTVWLPLVSRRTSVLFHRDVSGVEVDAAGTPYWTHLRLDSKK